MFEVSGRFSTDPLTVSTIRVAAKLTTQNWKMLHLFLFFRYILKCYLMISLRKRDSFHLHLPDLTESNRLLVVDFPLFSDFFY